MKTYEVFAESSSAFKLKIQAKSYDDAWIKAEEAAENGQFKEVPMSGDFNIYLVNEVTEKNGSSTT